MTLKQAAFLTSRVISLWFFYNALSALIEVPAAFAMMSSFASMRRGTGLDDYSAKIFAESGAIALKGCAEVVLAVMFYRFGPRVARFFIGAEEEAVVVAGEGVS